MKKLSDMSQEEIIAFKNEAQSRYDDFKSRGL